MIQTPETSNRTSKATIRRYLERQLSRLDVLLALKQVFSAEPYPTAIIVRDGQHTQHIPAELKIRQSTAKPSE